MQFSKKNSGNLIKISKNWKQHLKRSFIKINKDFYRIFRIGNKILFH